MMLRTGRGIWIVALALSAGMVPALWAEDQPVVGEPAPAVEQPVGDNWQQQMDAIVPDAWHVNLGDGTQVFQDKASAEAHIKERGFDQFPTDQEASKAAFERYQAEKARIDAQIQGQIADAAASGRIIYINGVPQGSPEAIKLEQERLNQTYVDEHGQEVWLPQGKQQHLREYQEHVEHVKQMDRTNTERLLEGIEPGGVGYEAAEATRALQAQHEKDLEADLQRERERMEKLRPKVLISDEGGRREIKGGSESK